MKRRFLLLCTLSICILGISRMCDALLFMPHAEENSTQLMDSTLIPESVNPSTESSSHNTNSSFTRKDVIEENYLQEADVESLILNDTTHYAIYFLNLNEGQRCAQIYHSSPMRSASMIKVFVLATAMEKVSNGELNLEDQLILTDGDKVGGAGVLAGFDSGTKFSIKKLLELMITESDNTATNMIIDRLSMNDVNAYVQKNGYNDTVLSRKMMDFSAVKEGRENYTSVRDLGRFFTRLYDKKCVGEVYDNIMIDFLLGQTDTEGIPAALRDGTVAHKTGELVGVYNDGGIIYGTQDSVLVVMTDDYGYRGESIEGIHRITRHFTHPKNIPAMIDMPLPWNEKKIVLTENYSRLHYGSPITEIVPRAIVIHWTVSDAWRPVYNYFYSEERADGTLNVASHFLVDRDGTIYRLTPETRLNRHIIGYNWCSIGIENVGGVDGVEDLTYEQLVANIALVRYLHAKFPTIEYVFGHYQQPESVKQI